MHMQVIHKQYKYAMRNIGEEGLVDHHHPVESSRHIRYVSDI